MKKTVCYNLLKPSTAPDSPLKIYTKHSEAKISLQCRQPARSVKHLFLPAFPRTSQACSTPRRGKRPGHSRQHSTGGTGGFRAGWSLTG